MAERFIRSALAGRALEIRCENLSADVLAQAKTIILDTLGCAFGGLNEGPTKAVRKIVADLGGNGEATILGTKEKSSCALATFANGTALRSLDTNDYYFGRDPAHASGNLAPILAMAERKNASGREILAALVTAYEVQLRLCDFAGHPSLWDRGWHHATNMSIASAVAAAKLLGLNQQQVAEAISIAGTHGNILTESMRGKMATIKATIEAVAAKGGVEAALMAANGLTGPETIFEGDYGWGRAVAGEMDREGLTAPLSGRYKIMDARIKPFPAFSPAQGLIQAALDIYHQHHPKPEDIVAIEGRFPEQIFAWPTADDQKTVPTNREMADHSPLYLMAVVLSDGACGPRQFSSARLADPALRELMLKASMVPDTRMSAFYKKATGAAVTVTLKNGQRHESVCDIPPGHPENRLTRDQLERKFRDYAEPVTGSAAAGRIIDAVAQLETAPNSKSFMELLAAAPGAV
jgi:2-methylcitrate dehydratase